MNILKNRNNVITYTVNKAINTDIYISVQNGEVVINAPWYMANSQIQKIVEEKKQWITQKIQEYEKSHKERKIYTNSNKVNVLGIEYNLFVQYKNTKIPSLDIVKSKIIVTIPLKYKKIENSEIVKMLMKKMYETITNKEIEKIMEKTRILTGIAPEDYSVIKMNNILAKCVNGKILINSDIATYKKEVIEYIILHEFCHLKYKNHTKSFYKMLETYMQNYKEYENQINNKQY